MRNLLKLIFQRVVVVSLALLLQIAFFVIGLHYLKEYYRWISIALRILTWVLVVFIMVVTFIMQKAEGRFVYHN